MRLMGPSGVVIDVPDHRARSLLRDHRVKVLDPATPRRVPTEPKPDLVVDEAPDGPESAAEPVHVCDECGMVARTAAGLSAHKRAQHG